MRFRTIGVLLLCAGMACSTGCGSWKDTMLSGYANVVAALGDLSRTKSAELIGTRTDGSDAYTGAYASSCQKVRGRDVIFGGCSIQQQNLTITGTVQTQAGFVRIIVQDGSSPEQSLIPDSNGKIHAEIAGNGGDCYILVDYADFTGTLTLCSEHTLT